MHTESRARSSNGWLALFLNIILFLGGVALVFWAGAQEDVGWVIVGVLLTVLGGIGFGGYYIVPPNKAMVLILFGKYKGTAKGNGFWWTNPFTKRVKISLRARTLNGEKIKVNELSGNPIEIAAVVVWRVQETAHAQFEVDDYVEYVHTQSEAAVRKLASAYPYDGPEETISLRRATDEVNHHLQTELTERLKRAGVEVMEARISHLAYASEIAGAMLQRQQAQAVVDARTKIVEGAVGMVELALAELAKTKTVNLDEERKASMVSNLMVVLCSDSPAQPVVNTGTLYP